MSVIASSVDETHDGLALFSEKCREIDEVPAFWWGDYPVWIADIPRQRPNVWPLRFEGADRVLVCSPDAERQYCVQTAALKAFVTDTLDTKLTAAEFAVFLDLATGLSLEESASSAEVAVATRRKQLQTAFRKLDVVGQSELVSLANQLINRFSIVLARMIGRDETHWGGYVGHLPKGVRCGVLEGPDHDPVRYLEIGPVTGRPVIVLHPMIFPHIDPRDVEMFHTLGWRTFWPIRAGCLSVAGTTSKDWAAHCDRAVSDIHTVRGLCSDVSVPVVAMVSSGAYATAFAEKYPDHVQRIDFVSTCFTSGKGKSSDGYFGEFLLRGLQQNGRLAAIAIQHLATAVFGKEQLETTLRRIFKGSRTDMDLLDAEFGDPARRERITFAIRHSIESMRLDYLSQLNFCWSRTRKLGVPIQFWHGAQDAVHDLEEVVPFSHRIAGKPPEVVRDMGHLTQGAPMRQVYRRIAATYSK
ncbi:helix-turn-helix transcriptional regulator [Sulfitobacter sp. S190]|uniref:helix-turn-helix transcriptional regulator n=1 Tax=Sulfitobacter sp. S190 TaxID=2867022 RepID=UPI0021A35529|nr:hypothetical protein [Sulfitobacter sp. S190]UWR23439.1 hypothetical protein K3756_05490 [Sulfitobacter sp. S190]